ncbi:MAG: site-specific DNA-methyltransferase [Bryobacteraceae bacterium]
MAVVHQPKLRWGERDFEVAAYLKERRVQPYYATALGALFDCDCMEILPLVKDRVVDTVFADPPFNLGKEYGEKCNDKRPNSEYLEWCFGWVRECVRALKPGGALFLYNLPKWNILLGAYLTSVGMEFRHWIAIEISACLPIPGRLHPSHYSLLYFTKGKPNTFRRIRTPIQTCRHCGGEVRDYGGHRDAMNPKGVNLKDVWTDIPPVRHWKFKSKGRLANALSTKILDRVVEMSTAPGDLVLDPFGGSGTTFAVCERKNRRWIGMEIEFCREIAERIEGGGIHSHKNDDYVDA